MLFKRIQEGVFNFPDREWAHISGDAKDLICHLLKREPRRRYTADEVLDHPWIRDPVANTYLATPSVLSR
ncbi:mnk-1 [Bugula neritina]|uniref:Mnk-1 n=1 Tax=Bugula neritina TaxID=10212 RepID=A0A7J7K102_BUGNE|nr:mnk-1 [Bugula neritina]